MHKDNPRTHLPQQNKKVVLTTVRNKGIKSLLLYGRKDSKTSAFGIKQKK